MYYFPDEVSIIIPFTAANFFEREQTAKLAVRYHIRGEQFYIGMEVYPIVLLAEQFLFDCSKLASLCINSASKNLLVNNWNDDDFSC